MLSFSINTFPQTAQLPTLKSENEPSPSTLPSHLTLLPSSLHLSQLCLSGYGKLPLPVSHGGETYPRHQPCLFVPFPHSLYSFCFHRVLPLCCCEALPKEPVPSSLCLFLRSRSSAGQLLLPAQAAPWWCWIKTCNFQQHWNRSCVPEAFEKRRWVGTQTFLGHRDCASCIFLLRKPSQTPFLLCLLTCIPKKD